MKKRIKLTLAAAALSIAAAVGLSACASKKSPEFSKAEYEAADGTVITVENGSATYKLIGDVPSGVTLSESGAFSVDGTAADGTQVVIAAVVDGRVVSTAICRISVPTTPPEITFGGLSEYVLDGGRVTAKASPEYAVTYSLKTPVDGVAIDPVTGRVMYTQIVEDSTEFTVVAESKSVTAEKTYKAAIGDLIVAENPVETVEFGVGADVEFTIDYGSGGSAAAFAEIGVIGADGARALVEGTDYSYDGERGVFTLHTEYTKTLGMGENKLNIYTAKNAVSVAVRAAKYVRTAEDLAAIGSSREALSGYYAMANDIDLSDYLKGSKGGWLPIGIYNDAGTADGTAYDNAFRGTFDGYGHKITGLWMDWYSALDMNPDPEVSEIDYDNMYKYFNAGLFGCLTSDGVVRNLTVETAEGECDYMCSYSGGIVGLNLGTVENCLSMVRVVMTEHHTAGGIVGKNDATGVVRNCISIGFVTAANNLGEIVGNNFGTVENCYGVDAPTEADAPLILDGRPELLGQCGSSSGTVTGGGVYDSVEALLSAADFTGYDGWTVKDGELPQPKITETR